MLGTAERSMQPLQLIQSILTMEVDLLWNGGIGTYVKASTENHTDVGDRGNDNVLPVAWQEHVGDVVIAADPTMRLVDFAIGLFDSAHVVYFASLTLVLLIAAVGFLETRRWR